MKETQASPAQRLRDCKLRPSPQRLAVFTYLCQHKTHPTAEMIYNDLVVTFPTLSLTTVYQTLDALCDNGLAVKLTIDDGLMRFDAETTSHGHFKCSGCGKIFDFAYPEKTIFPKPRDGFTVEQVHLYEHGRCPKCKKKK